MYSKRYLRSIFDSLEVERFEANIPLFYFNDRGDKYYIIVQGTIGICSPNDESQLLEVRRQIKNGDISEEVMTDIQFCKKWNSTYHQTFLNGLPRYTLRVVLGELQSFGDIALSVTNRRTAGAVSLSPSLLLTLNRKSYQSIVLKSKNSAFELFSIIKERYPTSLSSHVANILCKMKEKKLQFGALLAKEGTVPDKCYIIKKGEVKFSKKVGKEKNFSIMRPNSQRLDKIIDISLAGKNTFVGDYETMLGAPSKYTISAATHNLQVFEVDAKVQLFLKHRLSISI